jgi:hypothetical protein
MGVLTSAWSYNAPIQAWEPVLEPWDIILNMNVNTSAMVRRSWQFSQCELY